MQLYEKSMNKDRLIAYADKDIFNSIDNDVIMQRFKK